MSVYMNCTARGEAENGEGNESTNGKENAEITCNGPYFKEYCPEDMPCCFWDGKNRTCKAAKRKRRGMYTRRSWLQHEILLLQKGIILC
ncbi:hypothetical protein HNY73_003747 [Argiope bruennichi]|uniref:Uncharacterized protein n=1 Tax=Argiope bruennichi TaxID=94029 RepID=A0A8T0FM35_ARGBR|nr:hypothetical protein HNY73_003747 [Argiope bruennichi]